MNTHRVFTRNRIVVSLPCFLFYESHSLKRKNTIAYSPVVNGLGVWRFVLVGDFALRLCRPDARESGSVHAQPLCRVAILCCAFSSYCASPPRGFFAPRAGPCQSLDRAFYYSSNLAVLALLWHISEGDWSHLRMLPLLSVQFITCLLFEVVLGSDPGYMTPPE